MGIPTVLPRRRRAIVAAVAVAAAAAAGWQTAVAAPGARFVVNSTSDALDARAGDGLCRTVSDTCTLRAAVQEANALPGADAIVVPPGTYGLGIPPLNQNDIATGDLDITESLAIEGAGAGSAIVDGGTPVAGSPPQVHGLDRLFEVLADGGSVELSGLTFSNGFSAEYGGAVMNNSTATVTVTASSLTGNVAGKGGGAIDNHLGGAIHVRGSTLSGNFAYETGSAINNNRDGSLTVTGSTVSANSASAVGLDESLVGAGAIANNAELDMRGTIAVADSTIAGNAAGGGRSGATISNDGAGTVTVERTSFSDNRATGDGGAIFNAAGELDVRDSAFTDNQAGDGGAIHSGTKDGRATIRGSRFSGNTATGRGGAIVNSGTSSLTVLDSTFSKNSADNWGGAILSDDKGSVAIANSSFTENSGLNGGGFANEGTGLVTVENTTFAKNSAVAGTVLASGEGGGLHSNSVGDVVVAGGAFTDNHARAGGGLANEGGGTLTVTGTRFTGNQSEEEGGGILIQSGAIRMVGIDVAGNASESELEGGGGISYHGDKLVSIGESAAIEHSRIRDNKAKGEGGGIDGRGDGPLTITTTAITGNTAAAGGGIHHVGDAPLEVTRSTLSGNAAENGGGVFTDGDGETTVENATVSANRAGQFGGGLLVSSRLTARSSTVAGNSAASGGGINNGGGDLVGDGSVYLANTIVANQLTGGNCAGTMTSRGGNLDSADSCEFRELSDQPGTDPRLGPLADNGGPTHTHALLAESPAQERAVCTELDPCPPVDQRGVARPLFLGSDVGAYESELPPGGGATQPCTGRTERPVQADFDSWVSQSTPSANFGSDSILKVKSLAAGNQRALVHFALPPAPPGCRLVGATLRMHSSSATDGRTLEALRVAGDWSELGVTWANQPATAGAAATTTSGPGVREWDVLAQTLDMYAHGNHGFLVRDAAEGDAAEQSFHGTEKADQPPELVLAFDDSSAPPQPGDCPTTPQSLSADRDSWVSEGSPSNNFGTDSTLKVKSQLGYNSRALVHFPLPALPRGCTSIASATLRVEAASAKDGRELETRPIASAWSEAGVTWSNQPATTGRAATIPSVDGPLEWAVTSQVLDMYTSENHGFLIRDAAENGVGDEQTLHSRDKLNDSPPELVLVFDDSTPETKIESGPASPTDSTAAVFAFSSDETDATFECSLDGAAFGACTSPHAIGGLTEGDHRLEVRAKRKIRAVDPTPAAYEWTVAVPPETTVAGPGSPSASPDATVTFSADDRDASFECALDKAVFDACTSPVEYSGLADGRHEVRVRAIDPLGNVDPTPAVHAWTVAVPPETTIHKGPAALSNTASASFEFSANETAGFECRLDSPDWGPCSSPRDYRDLADGEHSLEVRATDAAGNIEPEPARHTWTIDTRAPITSIDAGPAALSGETAAQFSFEADETATFECRLDAGDWQTCASPQSYDRLADGDHAFAVRATDSVGNQGAAATYPWAIDATAPVATISAGPAAVSRETAARFSFEADETATFECRLDAGDWQTCASPQDYERLADGDHAFAVRATDAAGNQGAAASHPWTIDTVAPTTTISAGPAALSRETAARFEFDADEPAGFECQLDGRDWQTCASPQDYDRLADGDHSFAVRATDTAGNQGAAATYPWTIETTVPDTTPPETTIDSGPAGPTSDSTATFSFSSEPGANFQCRIDSSAYAACNSPLTTAALADGAHTFDVRAVDAAGNIGVAASRTWTIDTTAPQTTIDSGPASPSNDPTPTFSFSSEAGANFQCRTDHGTFAACNSPHTTAALTDGAHTFEVRATDAAGNTEATATSRTITIDTTAPQTTIDTGPSGPTNGATPTFSFSSEAGAAFQCRTDNGAFAACSSPHTTAALADGTHTFEVRATDASGNTDATAASRAITIDTIAPQTTISSGPPATTSSTSASFSFSANEASSSFECSLDGAPFATCTSPREYTGLSTGAHQFSVRATDPVGNRDATPANFTWAISTSEGCGAAATAAAAADAWIDENSPSNNKGTDSILKVQSKGPRDNFRALVRFSLPSVPQGCVVESAKLRLYAASAKTGRTLHALRVAGPWSENQVSWSNQPQTTGTPAATASGQGYREWEVTSHVQAMYGSADHGFLIRDAVEGADAEQQFHSREKGESPPQLVLRFAPAGG